MSDESSYEGDRVEGDKVEGDKVGVVEGDNVERATHLDRPLPHPREDDDIAVGDDDEGAPDEEAG